MKTVVGLFERYHDAEHAIDELLRQGFPKQAISVVVRDNSVQHPDSNGAVLDHASIGAVGGTALGGLTGMLVGLGALTIPGIGPVLAAGTITSVLGATAAGASVGAVAGSLIAVLVGLGIPEAEAQAYAEGVQRGGVLVAVAAESPQADQAFLVLTQAHAMGIDTRQTAV